MAELTADVFEKNCIQHYICCITRPWDSLFVGCTAFSPWCDASFVTACDKRIFFLLTSKNETVTEYRLPWASLA